MNLKIGFFCIVVLSCALTVFGGVAYNERSVCQCLGPDFKVHRCLCKEGDNGFVNQNSHSAYRNADDSQHKGAYQNAPYQNAPHQGHPYGNDMILHRNPDWNHNRQANHNGNY
jgi:hypothetical protein